MDPEEIKQIIQLGLRCYKEALPELNEAKSILKQELGVFANTITDMVVGTNIKSFKTYLESGLTREEAITLLVSSNHALHNLLRKLDQNNSNSKKDS